MSPYVRLECSFEPHSDDVSELYESVRSVMKQLRPFGLSVFHFNVRVVKDTDDVDELSVI